MYSGFQGKKRSLKNEKIFGQIVIEQYWKGVAQFLRRWFSLKAEEQRKLYSDSSESKTMSSYFPPEWADFNPYAAKFLLVFPLGS